MKKTGRDRILDAFKAELSERPFEDIRVYELIRRAKVSHSTYYYHFGTLDDVFDAYAEGFLVSVSKGFARALAALRDTGDENDAQLISVEAFRSIS